MGRWSSALTPISWETAGTGCMRIEITEHVMVIQLRFRSAGVEFLRTEWMHMCMCGLEEEMPFTSLKVHYTMWDQTDFTLVLKRYWGSVLVLYRYSVLEVWQREWQGIQTGPRRSPLSKVNLWRFPRGVQSHWHSLLWQEGLPHLLLEKHACKNGILTLSLTHDKWCGTKGAHRDC